MSKKKKQQTTFVHKAENFWKNFLHFKHCSVCGPDKVAEHYYKFKFYCEDCYQFFRSKK